MSLRNQPVIGMRGAFIVFQLILCTALAFGMVRLVMVLVTPSSIWKTPQLTPLPEASAIITQSETMNFDFNPFFRTNTIPPEDNIGEDAPETTLDLKLVGLRTGVDSSVILQMSDRNHKVFRVGDEIIRDVFVKAVYDDYVVLSQDGQITRLIFENKGVSGITVIDNVQTKSIADNNPRTDSMPSQMVGHLASETMLSRQHLFEIISLHRKVENNKVIGFRIQKRMPGYDLTQLGLREGDILVKIGTEDLRQGRPDLADVISEFQSGRPQTITITRDGQPVILNVG